MEAPSRIGKYLLATRDWMMWERFHADDVIRFWKSAYVNMCFSTRNRLLVLVDWVKSYVFGRDVSRE